MTWIWIGLFVVACIIPLTGYIYLVEIREDLADEPEPVAAVEDVTERAALR